jgi:hypothetical protein
MDVAAIATSLGERKAHCVFAGEERTAGEAVTVASRPVTVRIVLYVEVVGWVDTSWDKVAHLGNAVVSETPIDKALTL